MLSITHLRISLDPDGEDSFASPAILRSHRRSWKDARRAVSMHTAVDFPWWHHAHAREERAHRRAATTGQPAAVSFRTSLVSPQRIGHGLEELAEHRDTWLSESYQALRGYYGERGLPPLPLFLALPEDPAALLEWSEWNEETFGVDCLTECWHHTDPLLLWVANPKGTFDIMIWSLGQALDLWFQHEHDDFTADDSAMVGALLAPLEQPRLELVSLEGISALEVSYVWREARLKTASVAELLQEVQANPR